MKLIFEAILICMNYFESENVVAYILNFELLKSSKLENLAVNRELLDLVYIFESFMHYL